MGADDYDLPGKLHCKNVALVCLVLVGCIGGAGCCERVKGEYGSFIEQVIEEGGEGEEELEGCEYDGNCSNLHAAY